MVDESESDGQGQNPGGDFGLGAWGGNGTQTGPQTPDQLGQGFKDYMGSFGQTPTGEIPSSTPMAFQTNPLVERFSGFLQSMFGGPTSSSFNNVNTSLNQLSNLNFGNPSMGPQTQDDTSKAFKDYMSTQGQSPMGLMERLGIKPGVTKDQFFAEETPAELTDRMGLITKGITPVVHGLMSAMTPAPIGMALSAIRGIQDYNQTGSLQHALATGLGGFGGLPGAIGQGMQGNWGNAATSALGRTNPGLASALGLGIDAAQGKNVTPGLGGLAGMMAGRSLGSPVGGVFGQQVGKGLAGMYR